jgi:hypothetical protein
MKKTKILFLLFMLGSYCVQAQTANEIVQKTIDAQGSNASFLAIKTLQYNSVFKMNIMGQPIDIASSVVRVNNKLYRRSVAGFMGMKGFYSLITDTAGYISTPNIPGMGDFAGIEGGIKKMEATAFAKTQNQLPILFDFIPFYNTVVTNKTEATLESTTKVNGKDCYKIAYSINKQLQGIYFIDTKTFTIAKAELSGEALTNLIGAMGGGMTDMMGGRSGLKKAIIFYENYLPTNGVLIANKQKIQMGAVDLEIEFSDIICNQPIDPKWYLAN